MSTLGIGVISLLILWIGRQRGFFVLPEMPWVVPIRLYHVLCAFGIYLLATFAATQLVLSFFKKQILSNYIAYSSWFNFSISLAILFLLALYALIFLPNTFPRIWRRSQEPQKREDLSSALLAWILAFPPVIFLSDLLERLVSFFVEIKELPDQLAVQFLKSTFELPIPFALACTSILILAPLLEETLFRGYLQTFIRQHLGSKQAILITSVCFSLFHYSREQGYANIPILCSLFVLALFLGFIYEKRGSLFASILLHGTFNGVSIINLYFFGDLPCGL